MTEDWQHIAETLYSALVQMKKRRGVDIDDAELVVGALEQFEQAKNCGLHG